MASDVIYHICLYFIYTKIFILDVSKIRRRKYSLPLCIRLIVGLSDMVPDRFCMRQQCYGMNYVMIV